MGRRAGRLVGEVCLLLLIGGLSVFSFGTAAAHLEFDGDEGHFIDTARYFGYLFLEHDVSRPEWGDNFVTHTQPMLTRYVVGAWLAAHGYDLEQMPPRYDWSLSDEENRRQGRVPSDALLAEARAPMVALSAGAVLLVYLLGRTLGDVLAGGIAAALALASPLIQEFLVRAVPDAPLMFFVLLALLLATLAVRRREGVMSARWAAPVGLVLGLALAAKLTATLSVLALAAWGTLTIARRLGSMASPKTGFLAAAWNVGRGWLLALALAASVFVLSNPHLYPNPILHTAHLFRTRTVELLIQQSDSPDGVPNPLERPRYVLLGSFVDGMPLGSRGLPVEGVAAVIGLGVLLGTARGGSCPAARSAGLFALTVVVYLVGVSAGLLVAWPRYFLPTLTLGTILAGLGLSTAVRALLRALRSGAVGVSAHHAVEPSGAK